MITQFQYQQVCDELDDTRIMVKVLHEEIGELDKEIAELEKENREYRDETRVWVERLISEGNKVKELEQRLALRDLEYATQRKALVKLLKGGDV